MGILKVTRHLCFRLVIKLKLVPDDQRWGPYNGGGGICPRSDPDIAHMRKGFLSDFEKMVY